MQKKINPMSQILRAMYAKLAVKYHFCQWDGHHQMIYRPQRKTELHDQYAIHVIYSHKGPNII